jgi:ribose/xylose/arabinose/galactoside ABC-type transport system permease subunit
MTVGSGSNPTVSLESPAKTQPGARSVVTRLLRTDIAGLAAVYAVLFVLFSASTKYFFSGDNVSNLLREMSVVGIIAIGQTVVILASQIDLSVGNVAAVSSVVAALASQAGWPMPAVILAGLAMGAAFGLVNGLLVAKAHVNALVVTLGTMTISLGVALILTGGAPQSIHTGLLEILGQDGISILPYQFIILAVLTLLGAALLRFTVFGRSVYAAGDNDDAARLNGINVDRVIIGAFVTSGLMSAVGGLLLAGQFATADPTIGTNLNIQTIAAVVIGGTSLFGGVGGVGGTVIGAAFIATLANGMVQFNIQSAWQEIVTGAVIVAAVILDQLRRRGRG